MSSVPIYGQEDDDFAYEDEHIELESDNQEYDDLDESEFERQPVLIKPDVRPASAPAAAPRSGIEPVIANAAPAPKQQPPSEAAVRPARSKPSAAATVPASRQPAEPAKEKRETKIAAKPVKRPAKAKRKEQSGRKSGSVTAAKKKQSTQNRGGTKKAKKTPARKAASPRKSLAGLRKRARKTVRTSAKSGAGRTKRRKA